MHILGAVIVLACTLWIPVASEGGVPTLVSFVAERHAFRASVAQLLGRQQFETLEKQAKELREQRPRFSSGLQKLYDFYEALTLGSGDARMQGADQSIRLLRQWSAHGPKSGTPKIGIARVYRNLAWNGRGTGWASSVTPEGWQAYREHSRQAMDLLEAVHLSNAGDPELYNMILRARQDLGRPRADVEEAFRLGTALDLTYDHIYNGMAGYLLPRWHGRPGELEAFAARAADRTKDWIGDGMYVRVAVNALLLEPRDTLHLYTFSWPRLKRGLHDLDRAFPNSSRTVNYMAYLACLYKDAPLANEALRRLGDSWDGDAQEVWHTPSSKEVCRR